jgi:hypothetical protein
MVFIVAKYRRKIDVGSFMLQMERVCSLYREGNVKYLYVVILRADHSSRGVLLTVVRRCV